MNNTQTMAIKQFWMCKSMWTKNQATNLVYVKSNTIHLIALGWLPRWRAEERAYCRTPGGMLFNW